MCKSQQNFDALKKGSQADQLCHEVIKKKKKLKAVLARRAAAKPTNYNIQSYQQKKKIRRGRATRETTNNFSCLADVFLLENHFTSLLPNSRIISIPRSSRIRCMYTGLADIRASRIAAFCRTARVSQFAKTCIERSTTPASNIRLESVDDSSRLPSADAELTEDGFASDEHGIRTLRILPQIWGTTKYFVGLRGNISRS